MLSAQTIASTGLLSNYAIYEMLEQGFRNKFTTQKVLMLIPHAMDR